MAARSLVAACSAPARARLREDHEKFVASEPAANVRGPQDLTNQNPKLFEHRIAGQVSARIVDRLEVIDVDHQDRDWTARTSRSSKLSLQIHDACRAVQASGQLVDDALLL